MSANESTSTPLILASQSPRRATLLRGLGYVFKQISSPFQDPAQPDPHAQPAVLALELARKKAAALAETGLENAVLLAADTIVIAPDGRLLGTPTNRNQARATLEAMLGGVHEVVTAVVVMRSTQTNLNAVAGAGGGGGAGMPGETSGDGLPGETVGERTLVDTARVHMGHLEPAVLQRHLDTQAWAGKAGGYNYARVTSAPAGSPERWPVHLEPGDDPNTVTGLPTRELPALLAAFGVHPNHAMACEDAEAGTFERHTQPSDGAKPI